VRRVEVKIVGLGVLFIDMDMTQRERSSSRGIPSSVMSSRTTAEIGVSILRHTCGPSLSQNYACAQPCIKPCANRRAEASITKERFLAHGKTPHDHNATLKPRSFGELMSAPDAFLIL